MQRRQPLPRLWLMTDERLGDRLFAALANLPAGGGIVFRHYRLAENARRALFDRVKEQARRRHQLLLLAGPAEQAEAWGADGSHGRGPGAGLQERAGPRPARDPGRRARRRRPPVPVPGLRRRAVIPRPGRWGPRTSTGWPGEPTCR